jgi:hypothetical protein
MSDALSLVATQTANTFRSIEQQRANLLRAFHASEQMRKKSLPDSPEHVEATARLTILQGELRKV